MHLILCWQKHRDWIATSFTNFTKFTNHYRKSLNHKNENRRCSLRMSWSSMELWELLSLLLINQFYRWNTGIEQILWLRWFQRSKLTLQQNYPVKTMIPFSKVIFTSTTQWWIITYFSSCSERWLGSCWWLLTLIPPPPLWVLSSPPASCLHLMFLTMTPRMKMCPWALLYTHLLMASLSLSERKIIS